MLASELNLVEQLLQDTVGKHVRHCTHLFKVLPMFVGMSIAVLLSWVPRSHGVENSFAYDRPATAMVNRMAKRLEPLRVAPLLDCLPDGTDVAVVTLLGSLCPVTLSHTGSFEEARKILLAEADTWRPARLENFGEMIGFISLNSDRHVASKFNGKGISIMDLATRRHLVDLAISGHAWMDTEIYEGATMERLRASWPNLEFTHFCMNGADDVVKYGKYDWAGPSARFITMGRPGFTEKVVAGMEQCGVDPEDGYFILGPELPDISSTEARQAFRDMDMVKLHRSLHPKVIDWCLNHGPYAPQNTTSFQPPRDGDSVDVAHRV